ncbi:MAG: PH domain-containing protein [Acidobacteriota bacterium]|nr:PH domain-containing protein [Acidobacteriota bacterium]
MNDERTSILGTWRPDSNLMKYYTLESLLLGPFFPFLLLPRFLRVRTLRYVFDEEGVRMSWGVLFRREASLTYERIQDIHLTSNLVQRHLGLGTVQIQTASGTANAEVTIEGLKEFEQVRDHLYSRMRGVTSPPKEVPTARHGTGEIAALLRELTAEIAALRRDLAEREPSG